MLDFQGAYPVPGIQAALETTENIIWWGLRHQQVVQGALISGSSTDAGVSPTDLLRAGLLMGKKTSDSKLYPWDSTATDGTENLYGVLLVDQKMKRDGTAFDRWIGPVLVGGNVKATSLIVGGNANPGINGDDLEMLVKALMTQNGRFLLDDPVQGNDFDGWARIINKTADYSVLESDNNTLFTNLADGDAIVFTLPAPRAGYRYSFFNCADYDMTVAAATAGQIVGDNDVTADSVVINTGSAKIGRMIEVIGISTTKWLARMHEYAGTPSITGDLSLPTDLVFTTGTTGTHDIVLKDNQADALSIKDDTGGLDHLVITTTNGSEKWVFGIDLGHAALVLDSTAAATLQIGAVDILQYDDAAISSFAAATDTAGQDLYLETEDAGGTPTSALAGGLYNLKTGDGSSAADATACGVGGAMAFSTGAGGINTGAGAGQVGGAGGAYSVTTGVGGTTDSTGAHAGGAGGAIALTTGIGGTQTGAAQTGGAGGNFTITCGAGGATTVAAATGGAGGDLTLVAGAGGADGEAGSGQGGAGGDIILTPGAAGAGDTAGVAGFVSITDGGALFLGPATRPGTTMGGNWIGFEDSTIDPVGTVTNSVILYPQTAGDDLDALHADGSTEAILT